MVPENREYLGNDVPRSTRGIRKIRGLSVGQCIGRGPGDSEAMYLGPPRAFLESRVQGWSSASRGGELLGDDVPRFTREFSDIRVSEGVQHIGRAPGTSETISPGPPGVFPTSRSRWSSSVSGGVWASR